MHIAISGFFWNTPHVGSGQYLHQLVAQLPACAEIDRVTLLCPALAGKGLQPPAGVTVLPLSTPFDPLASGRGRLAHLAGNLAKLWFEQLAVPLFARVAGADLVHVPYFAPPLRCSLPVVATIHDLVPLLLPEYRGGALIRGYMRLVSAAAHHTSAILADSEQTRRDIIGHLKVDPARVTTVYLSVSGQYTIPPDPIALAATLARLGLRQPFVYYVGGFDARKNLGTLLRAWALACPRLPGTRLVLAGRVPPPDGVLFPDIRAQLAALGVQESVLLPGFVSDDDNRMLYTACAAFVFPSHYEGFGLPPLEALACGAPVICADASSLPEVVGQAAQLIPPDDVAAWAEALVCTPGDALRREQARQAGPTRAALFTVQRMTEETVAVYRAVLQTGQAPLEGEGSARTTKES